MTARKRILTSVTGRKSKTEACLGIPGTEVVNTPHPSTQHTLKVQGPRARRQLWYLVILGVCGITTVTHSSLVIYEDALLSLDQKLPLHCHAHCLPMRVAEASVAGFLDF